MGCAVRFRRQQRVLSNAYQDKESEFQQLHDRFVESQQVETAADCLGLIVGSGAGRIGNTNECRARRGGYQ